MIEGWTEHQHDSNSGATIWLKVKSLLNGNGCMIIKGIKNEWYMGSIQLTSIFDDKTVEKMIGETPVIRDFKECSDTLHKWWKDLLKQEIELIEKYIGTE